VYNYIHIGNARPAIVFDTVRRYLEFRGYDVEYVSNFTDVDDKLIKAAKELGEDVPTFANRFIDAYFQLRVDAHRHACIQELTYLQSRHR
jgi:cysteinyl-tRNA synthetase